MLLRTGAGSRYRSIAAAAARHAGRVNVGATVRRSNILVYVFIRFALTKRLKKVAHTRLSSVGFRS